MTDFRSRPLDVPADREEVTRADLVFYGVDHAGPSYEARVFLDNPDADANTPRDRDSGYAGSFTVFGHGGCYGDEGHCAPGDRQRDEFDRRPPHPLTPQIRSLEITEALKSTSGNRVRVDVVIVVRQSKVSAAREDVSPCSSVRLLAYQD
jgi:tyrosinase